MDKTVADSCVLPEDLYLCSYDICGDLNATGYQRSGPNSASGWTSEDLLGVYQARRPEDAKERLMKFPRASSAIDKSSGESTETSRMRSHASDRSQTLPFRHPRTAMALQQQRQRQ